MKYAIVQDMINRYGEAEMTQLTDRSEPPAGGYVAATIEQSLNDAEAEIDAYLAARYALPLPTVPDVLKRITCDIARYLLHGPSVTPEVTNRYNNAVYFLKGVSRGEAVLGINSDTGAAPVSENLPEHFGPGRTFSRDSLRDFCD